MTGLFDEPEGATPLAPAETRGLRQSWINSRQDLNAAEQANILSALDWVQRLRRRDYLSETFVLRLHKAMFGDVWRWAGTLRTREVNIGVAPHLIRTALRTTLGDIGYWIVHQSYAADEIAVRAHHRLVLVHPFPNGNGRHTRLMADLLAQQSGATPFTWGGVNLGATSATRAHYITCLRQADAHDIGPLLAFARS